MNAGVQQIDNETSFPRWRKSLEKHFDLKIPAYAGMTEISFYLWLVYGGSFSPVVGVITVPLQYDASFYTTIFKHNPYNPLWSVLSPYHSNMKPPFPQPFLNIIHIMRYKTPITFSHIIKTT